MLKVQKAGKVEVFDQESNRDTFGAKCVTIGTQD